MVKRLVEIKTGFPVHKRSGMRATSLFVGRDEELRRLGASLIRAAEGQGSVIFLTGQPGIGKTRLAREALALAKVRGFTALEGRAHPLEAGLAYAPILEAFGPLLRSVDPARLEFLVNGLPDLGRLFGDLRLPLPEPLGDHALEKTRLFDAVSRFLARLTQEAPVALFIDDVHWADPATLELLYYLARGLADQRTLLLATYPADDLGTYSDLQELIESLQRAGLAREVVIPHLEPEAVEKLVQSILGGEAPAELLSLLRNRAAGTPLFIEAFVNSLIDSGDLFRRGAGWTLSAEGGTALPPSIHRLVRKRLIRLAPADRRVLDLIAVLGDATSHAILRAASSLAEDKLVKSLRQLRDAGLIVEELDGSEVAYSIIHPLIQEVAYSELSEMERRRVHLAAIGVLERLRPKEVSRLARHYRGAGSEADRTRTLAALVAAGDRALALYANEEAARHFDAALAIVREDHAAAALADCDRPLLPDLLERLGEAWERIGRRGAAIKVWKEALAGREQAGNAVATSRLRRRLALAEWGRGHFDVANAHLRAGLAALSGREPCQELADLHFARFEILSRMGDRAGVSDAVTKLLALAERLASPRVEAEASLVAATSRLWNNEVIAARECALHALRVSEEAQELAICCRAHAFLVSVGMRLGDHNSMRCHAERALALAQRLGMPYLEIILRLRLAYADFMHGIWDQSLRYGTEAIAFARRMGQPRDLAYALAEQATMLALRGGFSEAEACISEARVVFGTGTLADRPVFVLLDIAEVILALERGQVTRVLDIAKGFARAPAPLASVLAGPTVALMPRGLMLLAEVQVAAGEPEAAMETARQILDLGPAGTPYLIALACRAEGLTWKSLGQQHDAMACLARAHQTFEGLGMPFEAARCLLDQASVAATALPALVANASQRSLAIFERLGALRYAEQARRLLGEYGITPLATCQASLGGVPVTRRELEIAQLVAQSLTTAEIAKHLTLTPGTVSGHLHRIYTRLGIGSRSALTRLVMEAGLLSL